MWSWLHQPTRESLLEPSQLLIVLDNCWTNRNSLSRPSCPPALPRFSHAYLSSRRSRVRTRISLLGLLPPLKRRLVAPAEHAVHRCMRQAEIQHCCLRPSTTRLPARDSSLAGQSLSGNSRHLKRMGTARQHPASRVLRRNSLHRTGHAVSAARPDTCRHELNLGDASDRAYIRSGFRTWKSKKPARRFTAVASAFQSRTSRLSNSAAARATTMALRSKTQPHAKRRCAVEE